MPLQKLAHSMHSKGFIVVHDKDSVIEKIIHELDEKYHAVVKHRDGHFHLEVLKTNRGKYTPEEYQDCKVHKTNLIERINNSGLGVIFNRFGTTHAN